jgi:exosortase/archaeosortase family protein
VSASARAAVVAVATAAAFWPVWRWYALRLGDGSDEKWGLVAVALAAAAALARRRAALPPRLPALAALVAAGALLYPVAPPLVRAAPALLAVALLVSATAHGRPLHAGTAALLLLALPLEATLQFYAGYPLRLAATWIAAGLLRACGLAVQASGTLLLWRADSIGVDAACSGIHMLWVALLATAAAAAWHGLGLVRLAASGVLAFALVVAGNALRVAALFVKEAHIVAWPDWTHEALGLAVFAGVAVALLAVIDRVAGRTAAETAPPAAPALGSGDSGPSARSLPAYVAVCLAAAAVPLLPAARPASAAGSFPGWPAELDGVPLRPVALTAADERFLDGFPGRLARFSDGHRGVLLRWLPSPTRQLHPAADCFRGAGYAVSPAPARVDARAQRWACLTARRGPESLQACERIFDRDGRSWTDPSSWWWAATLGRGEGPYWAVTVVEPRM